MSELERPNKKQLLIIILLLGVAAIVNYFLIPTASAAPATLGAVVNATSWCVDFGGTDVGAPTENVWFEYGGITNPGFTFKTANQSFTWVIPGSQFNTTQCGVVWMAGTTYRVRAVSESGSGNNITFSFPALSPHAVPTQYEIWVDRFLADNDNPMDMIVMAFTPYLYLMGVLFFGVLIGFIWFNVTVKQKSVMLSVLLFLITGGTMMTVFVKEYPEAQWLAYTFFVIAMVGVIYWIQAKRRK